MRVLQVYNQQRSVHGGEEVVVHMTIDLLRQRGIDVGLAMKSSRGIEASFSKKLTASFSGIYNPLAGREFRRLIAQFKPDIVHAHNVFPNWSPAIFAAAASLGIPTVYSVHSQILTCPTWYHLHNSEICESCLGGKEYWCVRKNCRGNIAESLAYAGRSFLVRRMGILRRNVSVFAVMSEFLRNQLVRGDFPGDRIVVVPNMVNLQAENTEIPIGSHVSYIGRLSPEKGLDIFLSVARHLPHIDFKIAGDGPMSGMLVDTLPPNVAWVGRLSGDALRQFYSETRIVVIPSIAYDTFPMTALEAMAHSKPVVASAIGGIPELVENGRTGLLVHPNDHGQLAAAISSLWEDKELGRALGICGRARVAEHYSGDIHFRNLMTAYSLAKQIRANYGTVATH